MTKENAIPLSLAITAANIAGEAPVNLVLKTGKLNFPRSEMEMSQKLSDKLNQEIKKAKTSYEFAPELIPGYTKVKSFFQSPITIEYRKPTEMQKRVSTLGQLKKKGTNLYEKLKTNEKILEKKKIKKSKSLGISDYLALKDGKVISGS